jgi:hypothetical protein
MFDTLVIIALGLGGAYYWMMTPQTTFGIFLAGVAAVMAAIHVAVLTVIPRFHFRREPKFADEYSLEFSEDGIHFSTVGIDSRLQWAFYSRALIDEYSYLLYYANRQFTLVPQRALQCDQQRQEFERLLQNHIAKIVRRNGS